jgi:hypothetical protein
MNGSTLANRRRVGRGAIMKEHKLWQVACWIALLQLTSLECEMVDCSTAHERRFVPTHVTATIWPEQEQWLAVAFIWWIELQGGIH